MDAPPDEDLTERLQSQDQQRRPCLSQTGAHPAARVALGADENPTCGRDSATQVSQARAGGGIVDGELAMPNEFTPVFERDGDWYIPRSAQQ